MSSVRRPAAKLYGNRVVGYAYVDDSGLVGFDAQHLGHLHEKLAKRSVAMEKSHGPQSESIKLGYRVGGLHCLVEPKPSK